MLGHVLDIEKDETLTIYLDDDAKVVIVNQAGGGTRVGGLAARVIRTLTHVVGEYQTKRAN